MKRTKWLTHLLTLVLCFQVLVMCLPLGTALAEEEPVKLLLFNQQDDATIMDAMIEAYKQVKPNVTIEPTYINALDYPDKILTYLAGGQEMDIVYINTISEYYDYASKDVIADLTDSIKESGYDLSALPPMFQEMTYNDRMFALPYKRTSWFLFYNKDIFDKEGIAYPGQMTWDEFRALAKQLTKEENGEKQWGTFFVDWILNYMCVQENVSLFDDNLEDSLRRSYQLVYDLHYTDKSSMDLKEQVATKADWLATWEKGNVAMYVMGNWLVPLGGKDTPINYGVAPLPVPEGVEDGTTWGQGGFLAIANSSNHKKEAFDFIQWACGPEGNAITASQGFLPAVASESSNQALADFMGTEEYTQVMLNTRLMPEFDNLPRSEELRTIVAEEGNLYLMQEQDLDTTIQNVLARRAKVLG